MMFKKLIVTLLLVCSIIGVTFAQTLKITDVESKNTKMYKDAAEKALGKNIIIEEFDSSVKVTLPESKPFVLKKSTDGHYSALLEENQNEAWTADLIINTTLAVTTSAKLTITVTPKDGDFAFNRARSCTFTAKRF